jgi:hypothetical protein
MRIRNGALMQNYLQGYDYKNNGLRDAISPLSSY